MCSPKQVIIKNLIIIEADKESHCAESHSELFCVTGKDSGFIDINSRLLNEDKMVI